MTILKSVQKFKFLVGYIPKEMKRIKVTQHCDLNRSFDQTHFFSRFECGHVDDKPVFDITTDGSIISRVDILHDDFLDIAHNAMLPAESSISCVSGSPPIKEPAIERRRKMNGMPLTCFNVSTAPTMTIVASGIVRLTEKTERFETQIPGLSVFRREKTTQPISGIYESSICVIVQGAKRVLLGTDVFIYNPQYFLITSVELPTFVQVIHASREKPCLGLVLKIETRKLAQMLAESDLPKPPRRSSERGMGIGKLTFPLLAAFQRLLDLQTEPRDIPALAPIIQREIFYRLLVGDQGIRLR